MTKYTKKAIAFVDVLGFKGMVEKSEQDEIQLKRLIEITQKLSKGNERENFERYGPLCCPKAPRIDNHLDYRVTQISDCVIISSELTPAGLINLINNCWQISIRLLQEGILCRGFISIGNIYHKEHQVIGPGYQKAYASESTVTAFQRATDELGTPFIEIDDEVVQYILNQQDLCVKTLFERLTVADGTKHAIFPFKRLDHEFGIGGIFGKFESEKHLQAVNNIRDWIADMKFKILENIKDAGPAAENKSQHYIAALDKQLVALSKTEEMIYLLQQPAVRREI